MEGAHARVLLNACGLGLPGLACVPGPGLPVSVHDENPAAGGEGKDGLRLSGQAVCFLFFEPQARVLAVLEGVDLALPVHRPQQVIVDADAGEPGVPAGVENRRCG